MRPERGVVLPSVSLLLLLAAVLCLSSFELLQSQQRLARAELDHLAARLAAEAALADAWRDLNHQDAAGQVLPCARSIPGAVAQRPDCFLRPDGHFTDLAPATGCQDGLCADDVVVDAALLLAQGVVVGFYTAAPPLEDRVAPARYLIQPLSVPCYDGTSRHGYRYRVSALGLGRSQTALGQAHSRVLLQSIMSLSADCGLDHAVEASAQW